MGGGEGLRETVVESLRKTARPLQFWRNTWPALAAAVVLVAFFLSQQVVTLRNPSPRFQSFCSDALAMVAVRPVQKLDLEIVSGLRKPSYTNMRHRSYWDSRH